MLTIKSFVPYAIYLITLNSITLKPEALKLLFTTKGKKEDPKFNYTKHVVDLRIHDKQYSNKSAITIAGSGVILTDRHVLTAAHLYLRGDVHRIDAYHDDCGGQLQIYFTRAQPHIRYKGVPPFYDIAMLISNSSILASCSKLKICPLPKKFFAYNFGGRAVLVGHEYYYEHFFFTTRRTKRRTTPSTKSTRKDPRYYSSEYYSSSESEEPCCSTPKIIKLLRRKTTEDVIKIQNCPNDIDGYFFCSYEQNKTVPSEEDIGTGVIDRYGKLIGILSMQRFVTYGSNVNFYVDVGALGRWIRGILRFPLPPG